MSRWKVKCYPHIGALTGRRRNVWWEVINPDGTIRRFPTWREAIACADRMARTVEVELPRLSGTGQHTVDRIEFDPVTITHHPHHLVKLTLGKWEGIGLTHAELEPVALYLLALAKQQERGKQ